MVFNWVWKNMLGGDADSVANDNRSDSAEVNDSANTTDTSNGVVEKDGDTPKNDLPINEKIPKAVDSTASLRKKNGGASTTSSRGRKNKLITSESTDTKKIRVSFQSDDSKVASSTTLLTDQLASTTRLSYPFDEMYAKLAAYKEEKGHCRVPQNYKDDRKLAAWVKNIRRNQKPGKVVDEKQIEQLNAIGFQWESKAGRPVGATIEAGAKSPARKFRKPIEDDED